MPWNPKSTGRPFPKGYKLSKEQLERRTKTRLANMIHGPAWKSGKVKVKGYIRIWNPTHHLADKSGYVLEHRLLGEENLGRPLKRKELVHHNNGKITDNRKSNLMIFKDIGAHMRYHHNSTKKGDIIWPTN